MNTRPLSEKQANLLRRLSGQVENWESFPELHPYSGFFVLNHSVDTDAAPKLVARGLLKKSPQSNWAYSVTELGCSVLCAYFFQKGLQIGFDGWLRELRLKALHDQRYAEEQKLREEIEAGLRYNKATSEHGEEATRSVIWRNVTIEKPLDIHLPKVVDSES